MMNLVVMDLQVRAMLSGLASNLRDFGVRPAAPAGAVRACVVGGSGAPAGAVGTRERVAAALAAACRCAALRGGARG
jgi:hypothetical protein